jgi:ankyrin repeat protein
MKDIIQCICNYLQVNDFKLLHNEYNLSWKIYLKNTELRKMDSYIKYNNGLINWACKYNYIEIIKFLYEMGYRGTKESMDIAILNDNLEIVKFLYDKGLMPNEFILDLVCKYGYLDMLKYLCSIGLKCTYYCINSASCNGHLEIIKFLHSIKCNYSEDALYYASSNGYLNILKYLYNTYGCMNNSFWEVDNACKNNHFEVVKYLHSIGKKGSNKAMLYACRNNNLEMIKYLRQEMGIKYTQHALDIAIINGNITVAQFLLS